MKTSKQKLELVGGLLAWFGENARDLPWRRTRDPYAIWISEIMLQQTQVKTVTAYWERWMAALPDVRAFARASSPQVHKLWEGLGYYARVRNAQAAARLIVEKHGGEFPETYADVLALPGVGRYTAGAVCSIAFNQPAPILDGNVMRVLSRIFGVAGDPRGKEANGRLWGLAEDLVGIADLGNADSRNSGRFNEALMELGALVCTPGEPRCTICPANKLCFARRENRISEFPMAQAAAKVTRRRFMAFIVRRNGRFLVRQRPAGVVNANLWEFPNIEIAPEEKNPAAAARPYILTSTKPFRRVQHSITRYRILLEAYRAELPGFGVPASAGPANESHGVWLTLAQLERLAFTSAHRKILTALQGEIKLEKTV